MALLPLLPYEPKGSVPAPLLPSPRAEPILTCRTGSLSVSQLGRAGDGSGCPGKGRTSNAPFSVRGASGQTAAEVVREDEGRRRPMIRIETHKRWLSKRVVE